jgi:hypothetical protein
VEILEEIAGLAVQMFADGFDRLEAEVAAR